MTTLLKNRVRAGILLYALVMFSVFSLILTVYLERVEAQYQRVQAFQSAETAYFIAELTKDNVDIKAKKGDFQFDKGVSAYQLTSGELRVQVILKNGQSYRYRFAFNGEN